MTAINNADDVRMGTSGAAKVYHGTSLVWSATPPPAGLAVSDDFNRANGALGANWTTGDPTNVKIVGNKLQQQVLRGAAWVTACSTTEQYAIGFVNYGTGNSTASRFGPAVRMSADATSYYCASIKTDGTVTIDKVTGQTQTAQVGSGTGGGPVLAETSPLVKLDLRAVTAGGNVQLQVYVDDVLRVTATDSTSVHTGLHVGTGSGAGGNKGLVDDWYGGDL